MIPTLTQHQTWALYRQYIGRAPSDMGQTKLTDKDRKYKVRFYEGAASNHIFEEV